MELWAIWTVIAVLLLITEVLTQMMWALCLTIGAAAAIICSLLGVDFIWQAVCVAGVGVVAYILLLPSFKRRLAAKNPHAARTGMDALLGRKATVTHPIAPDSLGRVRIDGDNWQVKAPGITETIPVGAEVRVTAYDSIILTVEESKNT